MARSVSVLIGMNATKFVPTEEPGRQADGEARENDPGDEDTKVTTESVLGAVLYIYSQVIGEDVNQYGSKQEQEIEEKQVFGAAGVGERFADHDVC